MRYLLSFFLLVSSVNMKILSAVNGSILENFTLIRVECTQNIELSFDQGKEERITYVSRETLTGEVKILLAKYHRFHNLICLDSDNF